ncbi:MAG: pyridoxamine 5'-phosphate oxidase family protein [Gammaproteobacteria bacterium]|nr:pyridoxamine 5'-phosphate oxidase family protein [Gammaproteobacteria bacterium]
MSEADRAAVRRLLEQHHTLTLATCREGQPWAATVFFASDADLNLYFVSDRRTRHGRDMLASPAVALAIDADVDNWNDVRGLQIEGSASPLDGAERATALALYLARFASVRALFEAPRTADEQVIAGRLRHADFWRVTPAFIRLVDNSRSFGFRIELRP